MTTKHSALKWGYRSGPTATFAGRQAGSRTDRLLPSVYDGMGSTEGRHYVVGPWPLASDAFGVAYPAGTLLVAQTAGLFGSGDIDTRCENFWSNAITGGGTANVFAVPQVLPGGYTRTGQANFFGFSSAIYPGPPWVRMTASGLPTNYGWTPRIASNGDSFTTGLFRSNPATNSNDTFRLNGLFTPITADVGYRQCGLTVYATYSTPGAGSAVALTGGSLSFTVSHNADGSIGSGTGDLDTIDFTATVTAAQLNGTLVLGTNVTQASYQLSTGALSAPLGIPCRFAIRVTACSLVYFYSGSTQPVTNWNATCQASLRCDIPFQCDIVGAGDLIAPGGWAA